MAAASLPAASHAAVAGGTTTAADADADSDAAALPHPAMQRSGMHAIPGTLIHTNTLDAFHAASKPALLQQAAARIWADIQSGAAERSPELLCRFLVLAFGDLKHHHFHYWFAFPALKPPAPFSVPAGSPGCQPLAAALGPEAAAKIIAACNAWRFPAGSEGSTHPDGAADTPSSPPAAAPAPFWLLVSRSGDWASDAQPQPLSTWKAAQESGASVMLAAVDPCNARAHPGWPLRNALLLAAARWGARELRVVCVRDVRGRTDAARSLLLHVSLPPGPAPDAAATPAAPDAVGWEAHPATGKPAPRVLDLSPVLSPTALADQAVDLNLRLMRWRAAPSLDTAAVARAKCLLLGERVGTALGWATAVCDVHSMKFTVAWWCFVSE